MSQIFRNRGVKVQDDTKQIEEVMVKRTAKNSVFLDLFQNKSYLLKLYETPDDSHRSTVYMDNEYFGKSFAVFGAKLSRIFSMYQSKLLQKQESENAEARTLCDFYRK